MFKLSFTGLCLLSATSFGTLAFAQDQTSPIEMTGEVSAGFTMTDSTNFTWFSSDLGASFRIPTNSNLTFGLDAGMRGFDVQGDGFSEREGNLYFEAIAEGGFGKISFGQTRSATEVLLDFPDFGGNPVDEIFARVLSVPYLESDQFLLGGSLGLRFDTSLAGARLSFSVNQDQDLGIGAQAAGTYQIGAFEVLGAVQYQEYSEAIDYLVGASASLGKFDLGVSYRNDGFVFPLEAVRAYGTFNWNENLAITAQVISVLDNATSVSLSGKKSWNSGAYVALGATTDDGSNYSANANVGFEF